MEGHDDNICMDEQGPPPPPVYEQYGEHQIVIDAPHQPLPPAEAQPNINIQNDIIRKFAIESTELLNFCLCVSVLFHILACSLTPIHVLVFTIPAIFSAMKAKKATKIGDYDAMHKWKRIAIIFNSIAFGVVLLTYFLAFACIVYIILIPTSRGPSRQ